MEKYLCIPLSFSVSSALCVLCVRGSNPRSREAAAIDGGGGDGAEGGEGSVG